MWLVWVHVNLPILCGLWRKNKTSLYEHLNFSSTSRSISLFHDFFAFFQHNFFSDRPPLIQSWVSLSSRGDILPSVHWTVSKSCSIILFKDWARHNCNSFDSAVVLSRGQLADIVSWKLEVKSKSMLTIYH